MKPILFFVLCIFICSGCAASSVSELKSNPGYKKSVYTKHGYQEALKIVKDEFANNCTVFPDMKIGECTSATAHGYYFIVTTKYIDETSSQVDFYTAVNNSLWKERINSIVAKLQ